MTLFYGHQPRIVYDNSLSLEHPYKIKNSEISQAFYGELKNYDNYFIIESADNFKLYLQILKPDFEKNSFIIEIYKNGQLIKIMDSNNFEWNLFYEEYGGDTYYRGPEFEQMVQKGTYLIRVYSPTGWGKYSLAVGKLEKFDVKESINALITLPKLKLQYWNKSLLSIFEGKIGKFYLVFLILLFFVIGYFVLRK